MDMQQQVSIPRELQPDVRMVALGQEHTCAFGQLGPAAPTVVNYSQLLCWGSNSYGQCDLPPALIAPQWHKGNEVAQLKSGDSHVCVLVKKTQTRQP